MSKLLVVVTVTRYGLDGPGFGTPLGLKFFHTFGLSLKSTHFLQNGYRGYTLEIKQEKPGIDQPSHLAPSLKKR